MYSRCTFCTGGLGRNEAIEPFPVGERLAFDPAKGRLWVVCPRCERWNLTPLEERWEALEACERVWREVRTRVSTDEIGLARLKDGTSLVRIGRPMRPEFAAWRYGDQFGRRLRRHLLGGTIGVGAGGALAVAAAAVVAAPPLALLPLVGGVFGPLVAASGILGGGSRPARAFDVVDAAGARHVVRPFALLSTELRAAPEAPGYRVMLDYGRQERSGWTNKGTELVHVVLTGAEAERTARMLLPAANRGGAGGSTVRSAVRLIEHAGSPERFVPDALERLRREGRAYSDVAAFPAPLRLGLEMALHEEFERRALEGELELLAEAWREAEEIASIADRLLEPPSVEPMLARLRRRGSS